MHAEVIEVGAHQPARREDDIETIVQPLYVATDRALTQSAGSPADDLRQIGMVESCDRNTATASNVSRAPRRMKLVPGLDEAGLQREQQVRPTLRIQWQAGVERAGLDGAGQ